jgi:hypothetical protein
MTTLQILVMTCACDRSRPSSTSRAQRRARVAGALPAAPRQDVGVWGRLLSGGDRRLAGFPPVGARPVGALLPRARDLVVADLSHHLADSSQVWVAWVGGVPHRCWGRWPASRLSVRCDVPGVGSVRAGRGSSPGRCRDVCRHRRTGACGHAAGQRSRARKPAGAPAELIRRAVAEPRLSLR